ncbi:MOSC domain-containing protein [Pseudonocardia spinosispora]|uniref:MOSC domain-containing protein n=1 Tax=Pseudonocardia spinosispora TaxID=103441 RepID=UPI00040D464B|nr:MOSC N-terminal beta barrel domain-containing protein [Pseudonocardia spinosispora]
MEIVALWRYPVKSMLGEPLTSMVVDDQGAEGDRGLALVDVETGRVATAKHPRLWRGLLQFSASGEPGQVHIELPDGRRVPAVERDIDELLSALLGRQVHLASERADGAEVERPAPEDVLEHGVDAQVDFVTLAISGGTSGAKFVDHSPLHLITTATLEHIGAEAVRYRPNLVVASPPGQRPFVENDWVGRELTVGDVRLRVTLPTPRCAVPTLEHGDLPRAPHAVRIPMARNRVEVPGFGTLPCAGVYLEVVDAGTIRSGDRVELR